jgi:membrane-associated phospholipid phosphatase
VADDEHSRGLLTVGLVAAAAFVALVALLEHTVAFDEWVWRTVLLKRGCATDALVDRVVDDATRGLIVLVAVVTVIHVRTRSWRSAWPWVSTCAIGLIVSKTLKHLLTRERPSSLPDVALGFSFPSAHAMNSIAALLAIVALAYGFRRRNLWWAAATLPVLAVIVGRVALGRHWICDVVGGALAALALIGLVVPFVRRRPLTAPAALAVALAAGLIVDHRLGDAGLRLPAPLIDSAGASVDADVGSGVGIAFGDGWSDEQHQRSGDSFRWFAHRGTLAFDVSGAVAAATAATTTRLALGARTEKPRPACMSVAVELNGSALGTFVPFDGWREYRLPIPAGVLRAGRNEVVVSVAAGDAPARLGLSYVRVAGRSAAD